MYHAHAMLDSATDLTLDALAAKLRERFSAWTIERTGDQITLSDGKWDYHLAEQKGADVRTESENITSRLAGLEQDSLLRNCDHRVEVWSDTPDPFMEYFERHFQILDVIRGFRGVSLIDPQEPAMI
jgi:hypothetical protein